MSRFESQETILQALTTDLVVAILDGVMCVVTARRDVLARADARRRRRWSARSLYGLLRWASYAPLRQASSEAIVWAARRDSHFLETPARHPHDQALQRPARPPRALADLLVETVNRQLATQRLNLLFRTANALLLGAARHPRRLARPRG